MPIVLTSLAAVCGLALYLRLFALKLRARQRDLGRLFTHVAAQLERRHAGLERLAQLLRLALPEARSAADALARAAKTDLIALNLATYTPTDPRSQIDLSHARRIVEHELQRTLDLRIAELDEPGIARCLTDLEEGQPRIETACRSFNAAVEMHNSSRTRFPDALLAGILGIGPAGPLDVKIAPA